MVYKCSSLSRSENKTKRFGVWSGISDLSSVEHPTRQVRKRPPRPLNIADIRSGTRPLLVLVKKRPKPSFPGKVWEARPI